MPRSFSLRSCFFTPLRSAAFRLTRATSGLRLVLSHRGAALTISAAVLGGGLSAAAQTVTPPVPYTFAAQTVGATTTATLTFTVTAATAFSGSPQVLTLGSSNLDFALGTGSTCINSVLPGTCTVVVNFKPRFPGLRSGGVSLTANGVVVTALVNGSGVGPNLAYPASPASTNMGSPASSTGMAFTGAGDLYLVDSVSGSLKKVANNGSLSINANATATTLVTGFGSPYGMALDGLGNVFVADRTNNAVKEVVATNGTISAASTIRTLGSGFSQPYAVAVDTQGNVYVVDQFNNAVKEIVAVKGSVPATNPTIVTLSSTVSRGNGIIVDGVGNVYYTQAGDGIHTSATLNRIDTSGNNTLLATGSNGQLTFPWELAQDVGGNIYVADSSVITEFVAVNGIVPPNGQTYTLASGQNAAYGITVDPLGNVFYTTGNVLYRLGTGTPPTLAFATTATGTVSSDSPKTVVLQNNGNAPLTFPVPVSGSTNPNLSSPAYTIGNNSTCPALTQNSYSAVTLAAGSTCSESISFQPTGGAGNYSGTLAFTDLTAQKTAQTQTINLTATGTAGGGTTAQTITFNIPASVQAGTTIPLSATASSGLPVYFSTTSPYAKISGNNLILYSNATGSISVTATQNGSPTYAAATAVTRTTGVVVQATVGTTTTMSVLLTFTTAGAPSKVNVLTLGQPNQDFVLYSNPSCTSASFAVNGTCSLTVQFAPKTPGIRLGAVQLTDSTGTKVYATANIVAIGNGPLAGFTTAGAPHTMLATGNLPTGLAFDGVGNLYYVDNQAGQLIERTPSGTLTTLATLTLPGYLAIDGAGDLFVTGGSLDELVAVGGKIPTNPTHRTLVASGRPYAIALDRSGNLFYSDANASTISELQAVNGIIPTNATPILIASNVQYVFSLAFDNFGNLYYSDTLGTHYFTQVGGQVSPNSTVVTPGFLGPLLTGMVFDAAGDLYTSDYNNNAILQYRATNGGLTSAPTVVALAGSYQPQSVALDGAGNLYAASCDSGQYYCGSIIKYTQNAPQNITFANADVGANSPDSPVAVPLVNLGNTTLTLSAVAVTSPFALDSPSTTCAASTTVAPGSQCNVGVNFGPVAAGAATGTLTFTDNTLNVTSSKQVSQLSGTAVTLSVTGVSPAAGPASGGNTVTIYGTVLKNTTSIKFGTMAATNVTVIDDQTVSATAPSGTAGTAVDIVVTTSNGSSPVTSADQYIYQLPTTLTLSIPDAHTGDPDFQIAANSSSQGNINYTVISGPATIYNGNTISLNSGAAGRVVVEADQDANGYYAPATVQTAFTVENGTGTVWIVNGDGSVSEYDLNGNLLSSPSGQSGAAVGTVPSPQGAAFDSSGNLWIVGANGVNYYTPNGTPGSTTPLTVGGISNAKSVIVDGTGHVWILNGNNSVSLLSGTGSPISPATGYTGGGITSPSALTIDTSGNLWITNGNNTLTEILGGAGPIAPLAIGVQNGTTGARP